MTANQAVVEYLKAHQGSAKYAVAISGANTAGPYIMAGLSVLPMGGFTGQVPFPTESQLAALIASGQLRYVLGGNGAWVSQNCSTVDVSGATLYDCAGSG
jgi:hypothetical protein